MSRPSGSPRSAIDRSPTARTPADVEGAAPDSLHRPLASAPSREIGATPEMPVAEAEQGSHHGPRAHSTTDCAVGSRPSFTTRPVARLARWFPRITLVCPLVGVVLLLIGGGLEPANSSALTWLGTPLGFEDGLSDPTAVGGVDRLIGARRWMIVVSGALLLLGGGFVLGSVNARASSSAAGSWTRMAEPQLGHGSMESIACPSLSDCWAVGQGRDRQVALLTDRMVKG
jgi:hypothetical protein